MGDESHRFLIFRFRTLEISWYFHFGVCVRIGGFYAKSPYTPSQHRPKRSSTALRLRSVLTHRRWFVPDKAAPRQTSLFGVLTSLSCRRFVKVRSGALLWFGEKLPFRFWVFWKYLKNFVFILKRGCFLKVFVKISCFLLKHLYFLKLFDRILWVMKVIVFWSLGFWRWEFYWFFPNDVSVRIEGLCA